MTVTDLTSPEAAAWALAEQIDASRQPLPVPAPFAKPMVYLAPPAAADGALDEPALDAPGVELQAVAMIPIAATATRPRDQRSCFMKLPTPPLPGRCPHGSGAGRS